MVKWKGLQEQVFPPLTATFTACYVRAEFWMKSLTAFYGGELEDEDDIMDKNMMTKIILL